MNLESHSSRHVSIQGARREYKQFGLIVVGVQLFDTEAMIDGLPNTVESALVSNSDVRKHEAIPAVNTLLQKIMKNISVTLKCWSYYSKILQIALRSRILSLCQLFLLVL